jgi:hypothetical protein
MLCLSPIVNIKKRTGPTMRGPVLFYEILLVKYVLLEYFYTSLYEGG